MVAMMGSGATEKGRRKGPWTLEEDTLLNECIRLHGEGSWSSVAKFAGLNRNGKSCRLRWVNYLKPGLKKGKLTPQEEGIIYELHCVLGNKWSTIAKYLPGRTDNEIKNYWRAHFKKKEISPRKKLKNQRAQALKKRKQEQQLEQQSQGCDMKNISCGEDSKIETKQTEAQENKQLMASIYSIAEDQCLPFMVHQEILPSWPDIMRDEDILVNLWDLDEPQGRYADYLGHSSKYVMQNQAAFGGGSNKLAIQDQDRVCCFQ